MVYCTVRYKLGVVIFKVGTCGVLNCTVQRFILIRSEYMGCTVLFDTRKVYCIVMVSWDVLRCTDLYSDYMRCTVLFSPLKMYCFVIGTRCVLCCTVQLTELRYTVLICCGIWSALN